MGGVIDDKSGLMSISAVDSLSSSSSRTNLNDSNEHIRLIVLLQSIARGWLTRRKFHNFTKNWKKLKRQLLNPKLKEIRPRSLTLDEIQYNLYSDFPEFSKQQLDLYSKLYFLHDIDGHGKLGVSELSFIMAKLGYSKISEAMLNELIREVDDDMDDKISLKQFVTILRRRYKGALLKESPGAVNIFDPNINVREFGVDVAKQYFDARVRFNNNRFAYDDVQRERSKSAARKVEKSQRRANFEANFNIFEENANKVIFRCRHCKQYLYGNGRKIVFAQTVWYHEVCSALMIQNFYRQFKARQTLLILRIAKFKQTFNIQEELPKGKCTRIVPKPKNRTINDMQFISLLNYPNLTLASVDEYCHFFYTFDLENTGMLSLQTVKRVMEMIGQPQTHLVVKAIVRECDFDGDGFIAIHDFLTLWDKHANNEILPDSAAYMMTSSIQQFLLSDASKSITTY